MTGVQLSKALDDLASDELDAFLEALTEPVPKNLMPPKGIPFKWPDDAVMQHDK